MTNNSSPEKGDIIYVRYTGTTDDGTIFDSTEGAIAKELYGKEGPLMIVFGIDRIVKGLENTLLKMKKGEKKKVRLKPEEAFGKRKKELLNIMSLAEFKKRNTNVEKGYTVYVQRGSEILTGKIKSINAGRVLVDFNHPLAGKEVNYEIELIDVIKDSEEKIKAMLKELSLQGEVKKNKDIFEIEVKGEEDNIKKLKNALEKIMKGKYKIKNV